MFLIISQCPPGRSFSLRKNGHEFLPDGHRVARQIVVQRRRPRLGSGEAVRIESRFLRRLHERERRRSEKQTRESAHQDVAEESPASDPAVLNRTDLVTDRSPYDCKETVYHLDVPWKARIDSALDEKGGAHDAHAEGAESVDQFESHTGRLAEISCVTQLGRVPLLCVDCERQCRYRYAQGANDLQCPRSRRPVFREPESLYNRTVHRGIHPTDPTEDCDISGNATVHFLDNVEMTTRI